MAGQVYCKELGAVCIGRPGWGLAFAGYRQNLLSVGRQIIKELAFSAYKRVGRDKGAALGC